MNELRNLLPALRVFDAVHRTGSVSRAAERLLITPSAVSHQLRKLEAGVGIRLVEKVGREIEFTGAGRDLALRIADLFDGLEDALATTAGFGVQRPIRIKVIPTLAIQWLTPRLADFYTRHKDIDIEIATVSRPDDTGLHNADFVVRRGRGNWPDLCADLLFPDELVTVCSPTLATRLRTPADLLDEKLLKSMIAPAGWERWLGDLGLTPKPTTRFIPMANAALCLQAAIQELGVALTQRAYVIPELASGRLVQPLPEVSSTSDGYYLVHDRAKSRSSPYRQFARWLKDVA